MSGYGLILGGGGAKYLFKIKAYENVAAMPASANENDTALITSLAIPSMGSGGIIVSPQAPTTRTNGAALVAGDVWLVSASQSNFPFAIVNGILVYLRLAFQWDGSAWNELEAYCYYGSAWVPFYLNLYDYGDEFDAVTGGWTLENTGGYGVQYADNVRIYASGSGGSPNNYTSFHTTDKIDLTNINTIYVYSKKGVGTYAAFVAVSPIIGSAVIVNNNKIAYAQLNAGTTLDWSALDVSGITGEYYICFYAYTASSWYDSYVYGCYAE